MRNITLIFLLVTAISTFADTDDWDWGTPDIMPGVNTASGDYPGAFGDDGDLFKIRAYQLVIHNCTSYDPPNWSSTEDSTTGLENGVINGTTISPDKTEGFTWIDNALRRLSSPNGEDWTIEEELTAWDMDGKTIVDLDCAYNAAGKPLYGGYSLGGANYEIWYDTEPYDSPTKINSLGSKCMVSVSYGGTYLVTGDAADLYESTGSGGSWSSPNPITALNSGQPEKFPTLGEFDGDNIIAFTRPGNGDDIYYAFNGEVNIESTSLGTIKATFK